MKLTGKAAIFGAAGTIKIGASTLSTANDDIDLKSSETKVALEDSNGEEIGHAWTNMQAEATLTYVQTAATLANAIPTLPAPPCVVELTGFVGSINGAPVGSSAEATRYWAYMGGGSIKESKKGYVVISLPIIRKNEWTGTGAGSATAFVTAAT